MRRWRWVGLLLLVGAMGLVVLARQSSPESSATTTRLNNLGVAYMNNQRFEKALEFFQQAYKANPDLTVAHLNQGIALLSLHRYEEAEQTLRSVIERDAENVAAWYNLGLLYRNRGRLEEALQAFVRARQLDPTDPYGHYFLGLIYTQRGQPEAAVAAYKQALTLDPFLVSAEFGLAGVYLRTGETDLARRHLERFQHLIQERLGAPVSLIYGGQGPYSLAQTIAPPGGPVPPALPVYFQPITSEAGINFRHAGGHGLGGEGRAAFLGSGACFLDYDNDGLPDLFLVNSGVDAASELYRNDGQGHFLRATGSAHLKARGKGMGCTAGDYDNDGRTDLVVGFLDRVALFRNEDQGRFREVTEEAGLHVGGLPLGVTFFDYDHDGDLDLYVNQVVQFTPAGGAPELDFPLGVSPAGNILWRNNGDGTFTDWTDPTGLAGAAASVGVLASDVNNDRAVDLVVTGEGDLPAVFLNPREGAFRPRRPWTDPMPAPTVGVALLDYNKDGWMDLAFTHRGVPGVSLWRNESGDRFEPVELPAPGWVRGWGLVAFDYDNDGWLDLAAVGETESGGEVRLWRNRGPDGFQDVSADVRLLPLALTHPRALITADYDRDGDTDLLLTQNGGPAVLLRNDGGNRNNWLRVSLTGLADNKNAIGSQVSVFAGAHWQKWEVQSASGYLGQSALEVTAGLGQESEAQFVRLLWPTGVLQDELELAARREHAITEIDRRGSSCPILFAWDGTHYKLVTDVIGAGIVGHWVGPKQRNVSDPTEYVKVEGAQPRDGRLSFRLMEPMEEVVYLDQARLLVVDHPADTEVYPNEYFAGQPPFPESKLILSRYARPPQGAWDDRGRSVLPDLRERDRRYVTGFHLLPFKGFTEIHALELDLGDWTPSRPLRLLLHGFVDYFTATSVYAAHQAGIRPIPPYVEALDPTGHWVRVMDNMGFPAGLARTMVADLSGKLPPGTRRIRLVSNLQIYWDQILIDTTPDDQVRFRVEEAPLLEARLSFLGYPRPIEGDPKGDLTYVYEDVSPTGPYVRHVGAYTRYGDVHPLTVAADDQYVVFGSGDEVALEFDATGLPPLPRGWRRDYLFYADGFAKDMDFYEAHPFTVEPLPIHTDESYPYSPRTAYPQAELYLRYRLGYNTRLVSGRERALFRFRYSAVR
ncbi:MAG: FG-GAP-like repeat-containing protein [Terriglobia bacterium]